MVERFDAGVSLLNSLRGLHDAWIDELFLDIKNEELRLIIPNITAAILNNHGQPPEYKGATLIFSGVSGVCVDVELSENIRIGHMRVEYADNIYKLEIDLNLGGGKNSGGHRSIVATFRSVEVLYE